MCIMFTLSVCMIVRDEEKTLDRILKCANQFADEIIIVDTGSKDNTVRIAEKYTDNSERNKNNNHTYMKRAKHSWGFNFCQKKF